MPDEKKFTKLILSQLTLLFKKVNKAIKLNKKVLSGIDSYLAMPYSECVNGRFFDNWTNQLRKGVLELCILNDIRKRKMYGYEIVRKLRRIEGLIISEGTIYNILKRLRRNGLVEAFMQDSPEGPTRKYYKLTEKGRNMVCQMNAYWDAISKQTNSTEKGQKKRET